MQRRHFIKGAIGYGLLTPPIVRAWATQNTKGRFHNSGPKQPVFIYNNWSAYDELSDNVIQTEELAMKELNEVLRLKKGGVQIDYYVMDAFWFDKWGGYREWHQQHWPQGPDKWLNACRENNIKPGMWFSTNLISTQSGRFLEVIPEWKDSLGTDPNIMCLFDGGYLKHLAGSLQLWYDKGVRLFKFDFAYFEAVTPTMKDKFSKEEIVEKNKMAFMNMLQRFREKKPDVLITGYNGFGGDMENTYTAFDKKIDPRWLDCFDTLYCGDPRFSDVPMLNIWRSADNYSDHQVNAYKAYGMPVKRIDNCAFMIGTTGTCYYRGLNCWKGMLILELARGGWVNVYHGNLELLSDDDVKWFARVQSLYHGLQKQNNTVFFGSIPGKGQPYGFVSSSTAGAVWTVVNPSQQMESIKLPQMIGSSSILYADGGYKPTITGSNIVMGPEQLAVVGSGDFGSGKFHFGIDETINIPLAIARVPSEFTEVGKNRIQCKLTTASENHLRIIFQQFDGNGNPYRSWPGAPPDGKMISEVLKINVTQDGKDIPTRIENDKVIWSGLSWAVAEIAKETFHLLKPLLITCSSGEKTDLRLRADVYEVSYS